MNETREELQKSLDKIISTTHDIKRRLRLLNDKDCKIAFHQKSHEIIDDRLTQVKKEIGFFIHANSIINKYLEITGVDPKDFFKKENTRKRKKPAHGRAKDYIIDARRVFCLIFIKENEDVLSRYLNTSRSLIMRYRSVSKDLLKNDKKFKEYYDNIIKKLNLDPQVF